MPYDQNLISLAICSANRLDRLNDCLANLDEVAGSMDRYKLEVVLLHNYSDRSVRDLMTQRRFALRAVHEDRVLPDARRTWPVLYNNAISLTSGFLCSYYSDDVLVVSGELEAAAARLAEESNVGALAFAWRNYDEPRFRIGKMLGEHALVNFGLMRRAVFDTVGGISEEYQFYHADSDLCFKFLEAGYLIEPYPLVKLLHLDLNRANQAAPEQQADMRLFESNWRSVFGATFDAFRWVYY